MPELIQPDPGFAFLQGSERGGKEWITELIRIIERNATSTLPGRNTTAAAITPLGLMVSDPPTQAEVQSIADKVDELIAALKAATGLMES